ncbi:MAG: DMT family transporter [Eubacteriales bacterium]
MKKKSVLAVAAIIATTVIWGANFVILQIASGAGVPAGAMVTIRFGLAAAAIGLIFRKRLKNFTRKEIFQGTLAGFFMIVAFYLQTLGAEYTSAANNGFITQLNAVLVPFAAWIMTGKRPRWNVYPALLMCVCGVFAVTYWESGASFGPGDILTAACAVFFGLHMAYLGKIAGTMDYMKLVFLQLASSFVFTVPIFLARDMWLLDGVDWAKGLPAVLYLAIMATLVCYLLQTWAIRYVSSGTTAILTASEGVWCGIFSVLFGFNSFSWGYVVGGLLIFLSAAVGEWKPGMFRKKSKNLSDKPESN